MYDICSHFHSLRTTATHLFFSDCLRDYFMIAEISRNTGCWCQKVVKWERRELTCITFNTAICMVLCMSMLQLTSMHEHFTVDQDQVLLVLITTAILLDCLLIWRNASKFAVADILSLENLLRFTCKLLSINSFSPPLSPKYTYLLNFLHITLIVYQNLPSPSALTLKLSILYNEWGYLVTALILALNKFWFCVSPCQSVSLNFLLNCHFLRIPICTGRRKLKPLRARLCSAMESQLLWKIFHVP